MSQFINNTMQGFSYQMTAGDPRIWVFQGCECVGWMDAKTHKLTRFASEAETNALLDAALKRKPPA